MKHVANYELAENENHIRTDIGLVMGELSYKFQAILQSVLTLQIWYQ